MPCFYERLPDGTQIISCKIDPDNPSWLYDYEQDRYEQDQFEDENLTRQQIIDEYLESDEIDMTVDEYMELHPAQDNEYDNLRHGDLWSSWFAGIDSVSD